MKFKSYIHSLINNEHYSALLRSAGLLTSTFRTQDAELDTNHKFKM